MDNRQETRLPEELAPQQNRILHMCIPPGCLLSKKTVAKTLSFPQKVLAGSGHILNDLCASMWFFYLLFYLEKVIGFSSTTAAILMFFGQIVDGLATPLIGLEADGSSMTCWSFMNTYGKFKARNFIGAVLVSFSFPFVFSRCLWCTDSSPEWVRAVYYSVFIAIFQTGWAASQISHLALIPKLSPDLLIRTELLSIRYGFTIASNVIIFLITWLKLGFKSLEDECMIDVESVSTFGELALISVALGMFFAVWFHLLVVEPNEETKGKTLHEKPLGSKESEAFGHIHSGDRHKVATTFEEDEKTVVAGIGNEDSQETHRTSVTSKVVETDKEYHMSDVPKGIDDHFIIRYGTKLLNVQKPVMTMKDWLKLPQLYIVAFMYMSTRLSVNVTQVYVPLYVIESLHMSCSAIASVPLTMYCSGFIVAMIMKPINKYCGRQLSYLFGAILCVVGSCLILILEWTPGSNLVLYGTYGVAIFLGGGASAILVTSLSITADLIGDNVENGALIYGTMSFCDKLSSGLVILLINSLNPCQRGAESCIADAPFYSNVLGYACGGCALLGVLGVIGLTFIICVETKRRDDVSQYIPDNGSFKFA